MKALSQTEIQNIVTEIDTQFRGAQLQDAYLNGSCLVLSMYLRQVFWLVLDLNDRTPAVIYGSQAPVRKSIDKKPVLLFLKAHGVGQKIASVSMVDSEGRGFIINLMDVQIHFCMIPGFMNLTIFKGAQKVSWNKPVPLPEAKEAYIDPNPRAWTQICEEWVLARQKSGPKTSQGASSEKEALAQLQKIILKKQEAAKKIKLVADSLNPNFYRQLGEKLKASSDNFDLLTTEEKQKLDLQKSISENMQMCFQKYYQLVTKVEGAQKQLEKLESEISLLQSGQLSAHQRSSKAPPIRFQESDIKARKCDLGEGAFVMMGKSGEDNLKLLRKARAWDLWFHLRDYPSTHAIIFKEKNQLLSADTVDKALQFLGKEVLSKKTFVAGLVLEVVLTECRFVRPLKNEKPGRVTYTQAKTLYLRVNETS